MVFEKTPAVVSYRVLFAQRICRRCRTAATKLLFLSSLLSLLLRLNLMAPKYNNCVRVLYLRGRDSTSKSFTCIRVVQI